MTIICESTVEAYEVKQGNSTFTSSGGSRTDILRWQSNGRAIVSGSTALDLQGGYNSLVEYQPGSDRIEVRFTESGKEEIRLDLPTSETALAQNPALPIAADNLWPWQLAGLKLSAGEQGNVLRFNPYTWLDPTRGSGPLAETRLLKVTAQTEVQTPAGTFTAWLVNSGDREKAWYADTGETMLVVQYFNGIETWSLLQ
jgi:hypothetical protein